MQPRKSGLLPILLGLGLLTAGLGLNLILLSSIGWSVLLWSWLRGKVQLADRSKLVPLMVLPLFAFPWIATDLRAVSAALRLSSSVCAEQVLRCTDIPVSREGMVLSVNGKVIEVSEACAGRETLQAMLLVGLATAFVYFGPSYRVWAFFPLLFCFAIFVSFSRVVFVCLAAYFLGDGGLLQITHDFGGWLVIAFAAVLTQSFFQLMSRLTKRASPKIRVQPTHIRRLRKGTQRQGTLTSFALWSLLLGCVLIGGYSRLAKLPNAEDRLERLVVSNQTMVSHNQNGQRNQVGDTVSVVRLVGRAGNREFQITAIDGTANRRGVHDPMYCWTVTDSGTIPVPGGTAQFARILDDGREKEILYWYSDGSKRFTSPMRYVVQAGLRRASLGWIGEEPILILVEPMDLARVNWFQVLDELPVLTEI